MEEDKDGYKKKPFIKPEIVIVELSPEGIIADSNRETNSSPYFNEGEDLSDLFS